MLQLSFLGLLLALVKLADRPHSPHKYQPEEVIAASVEFVTRILD